MVGAAPHPTLDREAEPWLLFAEAQHGIGDDVVVNVEKHVRLLLITSGRCQATLCLLGLTSKAVDAPL
jgi:hypothetical protein